MRVRLEHLTKKFSDVTAVSDFSASLEHGELISLLGPSGCGKSTILNMLAGILPVTSGKIYFDDDDVTNMPPEKRGIGLVFQNYALYPHMTVLQNIRCGIRSGSRAGKHGPRRENDRSVQHPRGQMPVLQVKVK